LNLGDRLVLRKAVLQSILVFLFSALPAPKGVLEKFKNIKKIFPLGQGRKKEEMDLGLLG